MSAPAQFVRPLKGWRSSLSDLITNWQTRRPAKEVGFKWLWAMVLPLDIAAEQTLQGVNDWGPGSPNASPSALPLVARSRGLIQGESEPRAHFLSRLLNWRATGRQTGRSEILAQAIQQYLGNTPTVRIVERIADDPQTFLDAASGVQWLLPSTGSVGPTGRHCAPLVTSSVTVGGDPSVVYSVLVRFRGIVEEKTYHGGVTIAGADPHFLIGGTPAPDTANIYSLGVSAPAGTYYLNAGTTGPPLRCFGLDYTVEIPIQGGATLTLTANSIDSLEISNNQDGAGGSPYSVPGITSPAQPFDGQFIQMDVANASNGFRHARFVTAFPDGTTSAVVAPWDWDSALGWTDDGATYAGSETAGFWSDIWIVVYPCEWPVTGAVLADFAPIWGRNDIGLGHAASSKAIDTILSLVAQWKGIHTFVRGILWSYDATLFDPAKASAPGNPDGTWGNAYRMSGGAMVTTRTGDLDGRVRYWFPPNG